MSKVGAAMLIADRNVQTFHILDRDGRLWLDCSITGGAQDYITFHVFNGDWDGRIDVDGVLTVDVTGSAFSLPAIGAEIRLGSAPDE